MFHASALCATVVDTITLPYRLARTPRPGPLGVPIGHCDLHSLAELLVRASLVPQCAFVLHLYCTNKFACLRA